MAIRMETWCSWDSERMRNSSPRAGVWRIMDEVSLETIAVVLCLETCSTGRCGANRFLSLALPQSRLRFSALTRSIPRSDKPLIQVPPAAACARQLSEVTVVQEELWGQLAHSLPPRGLAFSPAVIVILECKSLEFKSRALECIRGCSQVES